MKDIVAGLVEQVDQSLGDAVIESYQEQQDNRDWFKGIRKSQVRRAATVLQIIIILNTYRPEDDMWDDVSSEFGIHKSNLQDIADKVASAIESKPGHPDLWAVVGPPAVDALWDIYDLLLADKNRRVPAETVFDRTGNKDHVHRDLRFAAFCGGISLWMAITIIIIREYELGKQAYELSKEEKPLAKLEDQVVLMRKYREETIDSLLEHNPDIANHLQEKWKKDDPYKAVNMEYVYLDQYKKRAAERYGNEVEPLKISMLSNDALFIQNYAPTPDAEVSSQRIIVESFFPEYHMAQQSLCHKKIDGKERDFDEIVLKNSDDDSTETLWFELTYLKDLDKKLSKHHG